jgi:hypothetical protein
MQHVRSAAQLLVRLAGLADYRTSRPGPLVGSRTVRLWTLTPAGHALLARQGLSPPDEARDLLPYGRPARWPEVARRRSLPVLVVAYRLLTYVVQRVDRPVRVAAWEHPWIRTLGQTETSRVRHVRLPAAAALIPTKASSEQSQGLLLLPDLGTLPVASYRPVLRRLIELAQMADAHQPNEPLLIVGVAGTAGSAARVATWHALLQQVAQQAGESPLHARVVACLEDVVAGANKHHRFGDQAEQTLGLVARHPLLERRQLAILLGTSRPRTGQIIRQLATCGWVRLIRSGEVPPDALGRHPGRLRQLSLVELTRAGRREAARRLLAPAGVAAGHHGLLGSESSTRRFARHLAHTLGVNEAFVDFVLAARRLTTRGSDEALEEWRNAAACARGRFRPDGYGCYRRAGSRFGFFLEFDRGTEKPREYAAKLATYYRYRDSGTAARDFKGFPTLLVVTTSAAAEARFANQAYLAQQRHGGAPLLIFLTTTTRIQACPEGVLGPIWRSSADPWVDEPVRICWLARPGDLPWPRAERRVRVADRRGTRPSLDTERVSGQTDVVDERPSRARPLIALSPLTCR